MPELLSPAGDFECLTSAVNYGCDAVYLGGTAFGMRASPQNFDYDKLSEAVKYAHENNVKVYLTCNTLPRNNEIEQFPDYIKFAEKCGVDAAIASDIGVMSMIKKHAPGLAVHVSTQAGVVNYVTAQEFYKMGANRVVVAREMSLDEIKYMRDKIPPDMEIETFVHGAMCVSFSGRCLLSSYLVDRDANRGECAQPCRWNYYLMEEKRPNEFYRLYEDEKGSYILNAKDLCMINHLKELSNAGVTSFKIEGRAKSAYYVAVITNAYRATIDAMDKGEDLPQWAAEEVYKISHRQYCTGFFFGNPKNCQYYENSGYIRNYDFVGVVDKSNGDNIYVTQRNYFTKYDDLEIVSPGNPPEKLTINAMFDEKGENIEVARHALMKLVIPVKKAYPPNSIIRKSNIC